MAPFVANLDRAHGAQPERFAPRTLCDDPEQFGQSGDPLRPVEGVDAADARLLAANLQHWVANAVREGILLERTNLATILTTLHPSSPEMEYDRVLRTLRGTEAMQLQDLMAWGSRFDTVREIVTLVFHSAFR